MAKALAVYLGREAATTIAREGWSPELFRLIIGASGGPKWLVLNHLDRLLFGEFLAQSREPLTALGSSIGSWRHACLSQTDPVAAIDRLEKAYLTQSYSQRPDPEEVSEVSRNMLQLVLGETGAEHIANHSRIHSNIVTARARGLGATSKTPRLATAMGVATLTNAIARPLLNSQFQRVVFHSAAAPPEHLILNDFNTQFTPLTSNNVTNALHASGAIPFVLEGERDIAGAPSGQYWDGGIIDYHFNLAQLPQTGLTLYPHFSSRIIPGWFDKFLPWRHNRVGASENLVLLCPSEEFIADLPLGKIPDRSDFQRLGTTQRIQYWKTCIERSRALAEEFAALIQQADPLRGTQELAALS